jgi:voltage-gated potassium channel
MNPGLRKILTLIFLSVLSVGIGLVGFKIIEGFSLIESLYMTIITLSTVGFGTHHTFSDAGMLFVSIYIMINIGLIAYVVSKVVRYVFEGGLTGEYRKYLNQKALNKMDDHIIVCGFGRNGSKAYSELRKSNEKAVIIDRDNSLADELSGDGNIFIHGDAADEKLLMSAGIARAKAIIITLPNDAENVFITLSVRELSSDIRIISRASNEASFSKLIKAGANDVVMPDNLGGKHMAQLVTKPSIIHFLNMLEGVGSDFHMEEVGYAQLNKKYQDKSIKEMNIRRVSGASVVAHQKGSGEFVVNPKANTVLQEKDVFILLGTNKEVSTFKDVFIKS